MRDLADEPYGRPFDGRDVCPLPLFRPKVALTGLLFFSAVVARGFRRLLPLY